MTPRETLESVFFDLLAEPTEERFAALGQAHPDAAEAALAYLRARYVDGVAPSAEWEQTPSFQRVLCMILSAAGPDAARGLIGLALATPDVRSLRPLAEVVVGVVPPDDLARTLIDAIAEPAAERLRLNARELAYHTVDAAGDDYPVSATLRAQLDRSLAAPR